MTKRVLSFGACQLSAPITSLLVRGKVRDCWLLSGVPTVSAYCLGDALQMIRVSRGQIKLSEGMRYYCGYPVNQMEKLGCPKLDDADIAVLDSVSTLTMCVGDIFINRSNVLQGIYRPLNDKDPALGKTYDVWWHRGILGSNEEVRRAAAAELLPHLDGVVEYPEVAAQVLLETHPAKQTEDEFAAHLGLLRAEIGMPLCLITQIHQYFPDGRPVSWPVDHLEITQAACRRLDIPLLDTPALVKQHGVAAAMNDSRTVYRPEFYPVVGDALFDFMENVASGVAPHNVVETPVA